MREMVVAAAWVYLNMHPEGVKKGDLCRRIGIVPKRVDDLLLRMESLGYLLSEDVEGALYVFDADEMWDI